jgi:dTDP-4-dehydrorhamnose reductase
MVVLVTGTNGQLGQAIQFIAKNHSEIQFVFCSSSELDISNEQNCKTIFSKYQPNYCINAAAYTAVDKAETESEKAHAINVIGAKNLAEVCKANNTVLLHISTDFVFDGMLSPRAQSRGYSETDIPNPNGVYGQSKLDGEKGIQQTFSNYFIIRTSWVYSQFGNNFLKTMLRLASERDSLSVVNDQIGTPTNAVDLAETLLAICEYHSQNQTKTIFGIYNFSNEGQCSWFDFAQKIFEVNRITIELNPIPMSNFPTPAKRPAYSVLDKSKIKEVFGLKIGTWEDSLTKASF